LRHPVKLGDRGSGRRSPPYVNAGRTRQPSVSTVPGIVDKYLNERGVRILAAVDLVAAAHGVTPTAVALAWLIARPGLTAAIASATTLAQIEEFGRAAALRLDAAEIARLNAASD
jgi:aryl-alcohol dehydrogenase-like predicted oxidoreductase